MNTRNNLLLLLQLMSVDSGIIIGVTG